MCSGGDNWNEKWAVCGLSSGEDSSGEEYTFWAFIQYKDRNTGKQERTENDVFRVEAFSENLQKTELKSCMWLYLESILGN